MSMQRTARARAAGQSPVVRLYYDRHGDLRAGRAMLTVGGLAFLVVLGTVVASFIGAATNPETLMLGALIVFLAIKIPLLVVVFWILMRQGGGPGQAEWSPRERTEILGYLVNQAAGVRGKPNEAERIAWLAREAWHVADTAPDEERAAAVAVAVEIGAMQRPATGRATT